MFDLLLRGGLVVSADSSITSDLAISDGRIAAVTAPGTLGAESAQRVVDVTGMLVLPGGVDPHCHVNNEMGDYTTIDDFDNASIAALSGGTTTIVDFAIPGPDDDPLEVVDRKRAGAAAARCDVAFHGCITSDAQDVEAALAGYLDRGIRTVKMFTTYRGVALVSDSTIDTVMRGLKEVRGLTYLHAEENELIEAATKDAEVAGRIPAAKIGDTRPELAEEKAVRTALALAERADAPVYFVHQSTPQVIDLVAEARMRGVTAFTESCPHYLVLDSSVYEGDEPELFTCCPPIRESATVDGVVTRLARGFIDSIGSDNCAFSVEQKREHSDDVRLMPNGLPGVEMRLPLIWDRFVNTGVITPEKFVSLTSASPARLHGLFPKKGALRVGSDADITVLDPRAKRTIRAAELHSVSDFSPYEGWEVGGWPAMVFARGELVFEDGKFIDPGPRGEVLQSGPISVAR